MKILVLALAVLFIGSAEAKPQKYWTCVDAAGHKSAQDFPCPEPMTAPPLQTEIPALNQPQAQPETVAPVKRKPAQVDYIGLMLKPLIPIFGMFLLAALLIGAIKAWIAAKVTKAKVKVGTKIVREVIARIEPPDDLLLKGYSPEIKAPVVTPMPRPTAWSLDLIRLMEWKRFEELCEGYWRAKGYRAELTGKGADGGVDVNLYAPSDPTQLFAVIQCKSWMDQVGVKEIRELWGVTSHLNIKLALFYALSGYTEEAKAFASQKHFKLFTGKDLLTQIQSLPADQQSALLDHTTRGDYTTPTCSKCDVKMELREGKMEGSKGDKFWGCVNYPRCRQKLNLRMGRT